KSKVTPSLGYRPKLTQKNPQYFPHVELGISTVMYVYMYVIVSRSRQHGDQHITEPSSASLVPLHYPSGRPSPSMISRCLTQQSAQAPGPSSPPSPSSP